MSSLAKAWAKWKTLIQAKVTSNRNELPPAVSVPRRTLGSEWRDFMITFSASRNPHAPPPKPPLSDIHLPIEVWEEVIAYVIKLRDLAALARTCKLLHYLSELRLYRHLEVETTTTNWFYPPKLFGLYHTLQSNARIGQLVTQCYIVHKSERLCPTSRRHLGETAPCSCTSLDSQLGAALLALPLLKVLRIDCRLCTTMGSERHQYLSRLPTRTLLELELQCQCSIVRSQLQASILSSPAVATVIAFRISTMPEFDLDPMDRSKVPLPALSTLKVVNHDESQLMEAIISQTPVSAVLCTNIRGGLVLKTDESRLAPALLRSPGTLETLFMGNVGPWLMHQLARNPSPYSALRSLGSINLRNIASVANDEIGQIVAIIAALPRLESLEVSYSNYSRYNARYIDEDFLHFLTTQQSQLRRIYIVWRDFESDDRAIPSFQLNMDSRGSWHRDNVPYLRYWELVLQESISRRESQIVDDNK